MTLSPGAVPGPLLEEGYRFGLWQCTWGYEHDETSKNGSAPSGHDEIIPLPIRHKP